MFQHDGNDKSFPNVREQIEKSMCGRWTLDIIIFLRLDNLDIHAIASKTEMKMIEIFFLAS